MLYNIVSDIGQTKAFDYLCNLNLISNGMFCLMTEQPYLKNYLTPWQ